MNNIVHAPLVDTWSSYRSYRGGRAKGRFGLIHDILTLPRYALLESDVVPDLVESKFRGVAPELTAKIGKLRGFTTAVERIVDRVGQAVRVKG